MRGVAQTMVLEASTLFDDDNGTSLTTLDALSHMQQVRSEYVISPHTCAARPTPAEVVGLAMQLVWVSGLGLLRMLQVWVLPCSWCGASRIRMRVLTYAGVC